MTWVHDAKHEYESVCENIRHLQNIYFRHVTVFVTVTAGLTAIAFGAVPIWATVAWAASAFGIVFSFVSWFNAFIYLNRSNKLQLRAVQLEKILKYNNYIALRQSWMTGFRPGAQTWYLLYLIVMTFWILAALGLVPADGTPQVRPEPKQAPVAPGPIDWLQSYSEAVIALATVVGVLVAATYAFFTWRLWQETRRQAELTKDIFEATHRPWVAIHPTLKVGAIQARARLDFRLRNYGTAPAIVTSWSASASWRDSVLETEEPGSSAISLCIFPEGEEWAPPLVLIREGAMAAWLDDPPIQLRATVTYRGPAEARYSTSLSCDLRVTSDTDLRIENSQHEAT